MIELERNVPIKRERYEVNPVSRKRRKIDSTPIIPPCSPSTMFLLKRDTSSENKDWLATISQTMTITQSLDLPVADISFQEFTKKITKKSTTKRKNKKNVKSKKRNVPGKKTSHFKNIFWGKQQEAWMGSIRVKGTIVRSCSRKSDVIAAKILNSRCRNKGITPPNPAVGFLNDEELASHTQVRKNKRRGKRKNAKKNSGKDEPQNSEPYVTQLRNIFWGKQQQAWMGNIRVKGTIVRSCSRISDVMAAKILNTRCRDKGIKPPNPEVGFCDCDVARPYRAYDPTKSFLDITSEFINNSPGRQVANQGYSYLKREDDSNRPFGMKYEVDSEEEKMVNVYDPYTNAKQQLIPEKTCPYKNVFWGSQLQTWMGCVRFQDRFIRSSSKHSAEQAAKILNSHCLTAGAPPPNPSLGYLSPEELRILNFGKNDGRFPSLSLTPDFSRSFNFSEELKFADENKPMYTPTPTKESFAHFNLPPISPAGFDFPSMSLSKGSFLSGLNELISPRTPLSTKDDYKSLNTSMFDFMSDLLPPTKEQTIDTNFLDDLPFSGNWNSGLLGTV